MQWQVAAGIAFAVALLLLPALCLWGLNCYKWLTKEKVYRWDQEAEKMTPK